MRKGRIARRTAGEQQPLVLEGRPCPKCGLLIPENELACLACIQKRARQAAFEEGGRRLPEIASGRLRLRLLRENGNLKGAQHIALPNAYVSWCGLDLRDLHCELKRWNEARAESLTCQKCIAEIDRRIHAAEPPWTEKP